MRRFLVLGVAALGVSAAQADFSFFDDFEGYADTAAMTAPGAWGDGQDAGQAPLGTLATTGGNPGQGMLHNGGETNRHALPNLFPTAGQPIIWEFDFVDPGTSSNRRITSGLRVGTGTPLLEFGAYNNADNPDDPTGPNVAGYAYRTVSVGAPAGDSGGWFSFSGNPSTRAGTHHFRATILPTSILFELDLGSDGTLDGSSLVTTSDMSAIGWNVLRIGGPSDLSSAGGGGVFDNVGIRQIPEPGALALLGLGALAALRRR